MSWLIPRMKAPRPTRMPDEFDPKILEARRRKAMEIASRGGRASTILTGNGGNAPTPTPHFSNATLGGSS